MSTVIGLNVIEVDGAGSPALVGAAVSVAAFNILTRRGVGSQARRVTSIQQFTDRFGGPFADGFGAYMVKGFFDNGGQTAFINRVVADNAASAAITLNDSQNKATLQLNAGFRGSQDQGKWGNDIAVSVAANNAVSSGIDETAAAVITGADFAEPVDMSASQSFAVRVNADATPTAISFLATDFANPAQAKRLEIRDAINRRTTKLVASVDGNHLVLKARGDGRTSLQVTTANATIGLAAGAQPTRGTAAAFSATGTTLANANGFTVGEAVRISDGTHNGVAKLLSVNADTGVVQWSPALASPGDFDPNAVTVTAVRFDLTVFQASADPVGTLETWTGLSMESDVPQGAVKTLNDSGQGSRYVVATDQRSTSGIAANVPAVLAMTRLASGLDGVPTAAKKKIKETKSI